MTAAPPKYALPEIERRWLVADASQLDLNDGPTRTIDDRYITGTHLRLRCIGASDAPPIFKLGKKYLQKTGVVQFIVNAYLDEAEYALFAALPATVARKRRISIAGGWLDLYDSPHPGFAVFEKEFDSAAAARAYTPPPFAGREITDDARYSGFALAQPKPPL
jgi:CYTH domain-containing protein